MLHHYQTEGEKNDRNEFCKNSPHLPKNKLELNKPDDRQSGLPIPGLYKDHRYGEGHEIGHLLLQIAVDMLNTASRHPSNQEHLAPL